MITITGKNLFSTLLGRFPPPYTFSSTLYLDFRLSTSSLQSRQSDGATTLTFLPKISFVHSLPPRGELCTELARRSCDWSKNLTLSNAKTQSKKKKANAVDEER